MLPTGRILILAGFLIALLGAMLTFGDRLPFRLGRLPLDFRIERENFSLYFPLGSSILISVLLTLFFMVLNRR